MNEYTFEVHKQTIYPLFLNLCLSYIQVQAIRYFFKDHYTGGIDSNLSRIPHEK